MSNRFFALAFGIGLAALAWVGWSFIGTSWLALLMTVVIAGVFGFGAFELRQFRATTAGLRGALEGLKEPPAALADWLDRVPASLRPVVRSRIEGERGALPGPSLTPYLVGLLVMLGMLGTFLGMVVTFKGAVFALQGSTDLQAIRSALAEPIRGLGLSFGTSVAGVAASAMLGLMSAIARRERVEVARLLDARIATVLQAFSLTHHRQETVRALQAQADSLPQVVTALDAVMERMERRSEQLDAQLLERQAQLQREVTTAYTDLARKVGLTLQENLAANARLSGETVKPIVEGAMAQVVQESQRLHQRLGEVAQAQVEALSKQLAGAEQQRLKAWTEALEQRAHGMTEALEQRARGMTEALESRTHGMTEAIEERAHRMTEAIEQRAQRMTGSIEQQAHRLVGAIEQSARQITDRASEQSLQALEQASRVLAQSTQLVESRAEVESRWLEQHGERMDQLAQLWRTELGALRQEEQQRGDAAVQRLSELEGAVAQHLATLGAALEAPITRLLATASEVPQAAAGVITQLREEMHRVAERDNLALQERTVLLERLGALVQSLEQASGEQRTAIEAMVGSATSVLEQAHDRFAQALETQAGQAVEVATQASGSAAELGALAESFGESVRLFQASHDKLTDTLQRVEASLTRSTARSDEQLAYYVAQAREVIDLSIASQQGVIEGLRQLQQQGKSKPQQPVAESLA